MISRFKFPFLFGCACLAGFSPVSVKGQAIGLSGTVINKTNGQKLQGVRVEFVKMGLADTTDSLGGYRLGNPTGILPGPRAQFPGGISPTVSGNTLIVRSGPVASLRVWLSDLGGRNLAELFSGRSSGITQVTLHGNPSVSDLSLLILDADGLRAAYKLAPSSGFALAPLVTSPAGASAGSAGPAGAMSGKAQGKRAAAVDTLRVSRSGYQTAKVPLDAYTGVRDVALDAEAAGCAGAGSLCWDFEAGRLPDGWTAYRNEFSGSILVDGTKARKGAFALHAKDLLGGKEGISGGPKKSIKFTLPADFGPVLWGRAYVYTSPARPVSHAGLFNARYPRPGSVSTAVNSLDWYELATYQETYMAIWHPPEPPGFPEYVMQSDKPLILDAWTCLEWEFDGANGDAPEAADPRVWVDGLELSWPKRFVFSDPAGAPRPKQEKAKNFTFLEAGAYLYQGLSLATNWWIDDLAVGPRRIGCN